MTTHTTSIRIERTDGVIIGLTSLDINLVISGITYLSAAGFTRTDYESNSSLSVNNAEVEGILTAAGIDRVDISKGLYDYAQIFAFVYDYTALSIVKNLARGRWGEATLFENRYVAEFRSLSQALQQQIVEVYSADCRADLGDVRCGIDINLFTVSGAVATIDNFKFWRINIATANSSALAVPEMQMRSTIGGADQANGGIATSQFVAPISSPDNAFDNNEGTDWESNNVPVWLQYEFIAPIKIVEYGIFIFSSFSRRPVTWTFENSIDGALWTVVHAYNGPTLGTGWHFFLTTISAQPTNRNAFSDSARTEPSGWFDGGKLTWTSGANIGLSVEVKKYAFTAGSGGDFELWHDVPFDIQNGDTFDVEAGCDKKLSTCRDKFNIVVNFRGEPFIPGIDQVSKFGGQ